MKTKCGSPQNFLQYGGEVRQQVFIVVVYQPIVSDDPVDLFLRFLEHLWVLNHAQQEGRQRGTGLKS